MTLGCGLWAIGYGKKKKAPEYMPELLVTPEVGFRIPAIARSPQPIALIFTAPAP